MDTNNVLPVDPTDLSEDVVMTTETTTTQSVTVEETNKNQDSLDQVLAEPIQDKDYDSSDLDLSSDEDSSSADEGAADPDHDDDDDDDDVDDDEEQPSKDMPVSANELTDITINRPQFEMTADTKVEYVGTIFSVIDKTVVVQSQTLGNVLDMESLLVFEQDRTILGEVFETFGPVDRPFYSVRFNSGDEIPALAVSGARISYVPAYERTQLVQVEKLKLIKGTDASNRYDEEAGDDELEFSDDEKEMAYNRSKKRKNKNKQKNKAANTKTTEEQQPTMDNDRRQLQSYADIMGPIANPAPSQQTDTMGDLLNSYMTARVPRPHAESSSATTFAYSQKVNTVKQDPAPPIVNREPVTPSTTTVKQDPTPPVVNQEPVTPSTITTTVKQESCTIVNQEPPPTVKPEQLSFFQSIRSLFSRGPPAS